LIVTDSPLQTKSVLQARTGVAIEPTFTCTVFDNGLVQVLDTLQVAEYVVVAVGLTIIDVPV
jgi:hypothetical protein